MSPKPTASAVHVNRPLTNISIAFIQEENAFIADQVFPLIPVQKQSDLFFTYDKGDFLRVEAKERAPSTESAGGGFGLDTQSYFADVFAFHKDVDDQIRANADQPLDMDRDATIYVTRQMLLKRERQWLDDFFTTGVWTTDQTGGVDFTQWDDAASDPIGDITDEALNITSRTGFRPNTLVVGPEVFNALRNHPDVLDRIKYTQGPAIPTNQIMAQLFGVDRVLVAWAVENTAAEGATDSISYMAGKNAFLAYSNPTPAIMQPSAGYTFSWTGFLGAGEQGTRIKRFRMEELSSDRIEGEMAFDQNIVSADLGSFFSSAVS